MPPPPPHCHDIYYLFLPVYNPSPVQYFFSSLALFFSVQFLNIQLIYIIAKKETTLDF